MSFPYKHILLIGATSGIGKAMADKLVAEGIHVTAVGRRQDRLDAFVSAHGSSKASSLTLDISKLDTIPAFAENAVKQFPSIDAIYINAGNQAHYNFTDPSSVDLNKFFAELTVNFSSAVALVHAFLPHLLAASNPTAFIYTGTNISLVPVGSLPAYTASKTALDAFMRCLRDQLIETKVRVLHVSPPVVQTELHDYMGQEVGRNMGMPVSQFVEEVWSQLGKGEQEVIVGSIGATTNEQLREMTMKRVAAAEQLNGMMRKMQAQRAGH